MVSSVSSGMQIHVIAQEHLITMKRKIAVVGMSFRFPGTSSEQYWPDLLNGKDLVSSVDPTRWAQETFRHPNKNHAGTSYTYAAGSIGDISTFDAAFFGISPREAAQMDPQQRLLLEMSWEAFENAGIRPAAVKGSKCGVYIGISSADYAYRFADDLGAIDSTVATGNTASIAANRISYVFDLRGPSMALDTACSSSLVAFHQACQSVASGESSLAIAGGVSLHLHPYGFIAFSKASMLSRRGRCNVFDAAGDGYVRSEGGGIFILKDYDQAVADGNPILAIVAASAINSDGKKSGLTVPSSQAQATLLKDAYADAGIDPADIDYIEAHGTGTAVGDPIETRALGDALAKFRSKDRPLLIGSVKSNLGHLEAASGVAGLVKAVFCVQHRMVPATINVDTPNPNIAFDDWNLRIAHKTTALKQTGKLVIGVNSFGFGGANAHVILESPAAKVTPLQPRPPKPQLGTDLPLVVSGKSEAALKAAARDYATFLRQHQSVPLYDIAYGATFNREWHESRAVVFGSTHKSLASALENFASGTASGLPVESATALASPVKIAFIYSGNGSQWEGMGKRLLLEDDTFRAAVQRVDQIFKRYANFSLEDELAGNNGEGRLALTEIAQPTLFAVQVGITEMLRSRGLAPNAVAGHSVGEIAAAWASGALTLEQAVQVIYHRSQLQATTKGRGQMTAVGLGEAAMRQVLQETRLEHAVAIAGVNSSKGVTIAGDDASLATLEAVLAERKIFYKRLDLDYAFHSAAMNPIESSIYKALGALAPGEEQLPFISTVTGERLSGALLDAYYWWQNIRNPVLFEQAVKTARGMGIDLFIEIGPHAVLRGYLNDSLKDSHKDGGAPGRVVTTLSRGDDAPERVWSAAAKVMIAGAPVDWSRFFPHPAQFTPLPNYPWQRERYWQTVTSESENLLQRYKVHPLLGYRLSQQDFTWENQLDPLLNPTLADHVVGDATVFPGTGFAELALAAAAQWSLGNAPDEKLEIEELEIRAPLLLSTEHSKSLRVSIDPADGSFAVKARDQHSGEAWTLHATGRIPAEPQGVLFVDEKPGVPLRQPDFDAELHTRLTEMVGLNYGPAFKAIDAGWVEGDSVWARLVAPDAIKPELGSTLLHPALLDCTFQLIIHLLRDQIATQAGVAYVPTRIGRLIFKTGKSMPVLARADLVRRSPQSLTANFALFDEQGEVVAWLRGVRFRAVRLRKDSSDHLRFLDYVGIPQPHARAAGIVLPTLAEEVRKALAAATLALAKGSAFQPYTQQIEPLLDALCAAFAADALKRIAGGSELSDERVAQLAERNPSSAALVARLIDMLEEDGVLERGAEDGDDNGWHFLNADEGPGAHDIWNALVADHPDHFAIFNAVGRIGLNLERLLDGRATIEQLLPRECTVAAMSAEVVGHAATRSFGLALQQCVTTALERLSEGQRFRIVEISDGTPTFAADLLRSLPRDRCDYVVATTNRATAEDCLHRVDRLPGVVAQVFGDEADAAATQNMQATQEAQTAGFQLALLVNDFASDEDAQRALRQAQQMLAADGTLVLLGTPSSRWLDLVFGATQHWWPPRSEAVPAMTARSASHWEQRLQALGFESCATLPLVPHAPATPYVMVARAGAQLNVANIAEVAKADAPSTAKPAWIVLVDDSVFATATARDFASRIVAGGGYVAVVGAMRHAAVDCSHADINPGDAHAMSALLSHVKATHGAVSGVVHLYGLGRNDTLAGATQLLAHQVERCAIASALVQACEQAEVDTTCWLVTAGATAGLLPQRQTQYADMADAPLWGLGRTLMNEPSRLTIRLVDLERGFGPELVPAGFVARTPVDALDSVVAAALAAEIMSADAEQEVMLTARGERFVPRLRVMPRHLVENQKPALSTTLRLGFQFAGQLRNLRWQAFPRTRPAADEIEIEVAATGLNFRDVMYALGLLSEEAVENGFAGPTLGLECAGVVIGVGAGVEGFGLGDRVVAFGPSSFSNHVLTKASGVSRIPPGISFEAAATIPSTFFTAYYALHHLARLREGEKILIHGAAGGVGIAAIQLAKYFGAEIFATAGSDEKRDFLRLLGVDHIFDSRSLAFADEILAVTQGKGVDVVLNSLAGEAINRNFRVLKPFGRFLELGKRDFYENTKIGLRPFRNNISYFGIDADQLMQEQPLLTQALFREVMELFGQGILHPLPFHTFEADDVVDAFRHMQQAKQIGKVVVTYQNGINTVFTPPPVQQQLALSAKATYLVTGGLGGFGLRTAQWLVTKGAKNLVLISRSGPASAEAQATVTELQARGIKVLATACDVTDRKALSTLFAQIAAKMPPLRGIVHAAVVIEDALIRNTNAEQIRKVFAPKILGAQYLHELTRDMKMDFFVLFSSATTLFGNPGQGNYVAANAQLEALAMARRAAGLPALCVRWGAIDDVGFLARNEQIKNALQSRMGGSTIQSADALNILEELIITDRSNLGVLELDWQALSRFLPSAPSPKFHDLLGQVAEGESDEDHADDIQRLLAELPPEELAATFRELLKAEIGEILRIPPEKLDATRSVYDMGLDSLMGVELALAIESRFGIRLPVMALSESPTIEKLADKIIAQLKSAGAPGDAAPAAPAANIAAQVQQMVSLHAADVDAKSIEEFAAELHSGDAVKSSRIIH